MSTKSPVDRGGIVGWWASNPVAANLLMLVCFLGGIMGYARMDQQMFPVSPINGAQVTVSWPGASPRDVEEQIVLRIEEAVSDIADLKRLQSRVSEGYASIYIEAELSTDMSEFVREVEQKIGSINSLPVDSYRPNVQQLIQRNWYMGLVVHGQIDDRSMRRLVDDLRDEISQLPGGTLARAGGVLPEEVSIEISEENLRRYNITFNEVADAIRRGSINSSGASIRTGAGDVPIVARSLADTADEFGAIILRQSAETGTLRVGDIATVIDGTVDVNLEVNFGDDPAAFIFLPAPDRMQIVEYTDAIKGFIDEANDYSNNILPQGVKISVLWDDSRSFKARMNLIAESALLGAFLVCLVLVLFLNPIVAFWVTIGIITAFAGGILLLPYLGVSWNVLSTFAVLLVIGVIVDDAIVVAENIHNEVESGRREGLDAAIIGTQMVVKPVIFGVATTIVAFLPWAFLSGPERNFTQQITFVVIAALVFSIIECMLILPAHLSHLKKQAKDNLGWLGRTQSQIAGTMIWFAKSVYKPVLEFALRFRYATCAFFASLFWLATSIVGSGYVPFAFMPEVEGELIQVEIDFPEGTPYARVQQVRDQLLFAVDETTEQYLEIYPDVEEGMIRTASMVAEADEIRAWIGLAYAENRPPTLKTLEISQKLQDNFGSVDDAEEISFNYTMNESDNAVSFALKHQDLDRLNEAAEYVKDHLRNTYGNVYYVRDNLSSAAEEIRLSLKPGANATGLTLADITRQVNQAFYGQEVLRLPRDGEDVRVMVRLSEEERRQLETLNALQIQTNSGDVVPLREVANFEFVPGINRIIRRDRVRSLNVRADVVGDGARGTIMADMNANFWPSFAETFPDVKRQVAGEYEQEQDFLKEITGFVIMSLFVMYVLLATAFKSYTQPILLMTAIPFGYAGAVFGHWAWDVNMALFSFFGIAAAGGVVINDNLVLIDAVNRKRDEGLGAIQALIDAGVSRFRPILLTSITTVVGILPLLFEPSVQAQFLKPMLVALASAVAFAIFVSLLLVPAMYAVGVEIGRFFRWTWGGRPFVPLGTNYTGQLGDVSHA